MTEREVEMRETRERRESFILGFTPQMAVIVGAGAC